LALHIHLYTFEISLFYTCSFHFRCLFLVGFGGVHCLIFAIRMLLTFEIAFSIFALESKLIFVSSLTIDWFTRSWYLSLSTFSHFIVLFMFWSFSIILRVNSELHSRLWILDNGPKQSGLVLLLENCLKVDELNRK
jgi:hypothetical protein